MGGCMGEYRRARGSLHVRGAFWLRSQVPIRRAKGPSFTQDEDIIYILKIYYDSVAPCRGRTAGTQNPSDDAVTA